MTDIKGFPPTAGEVFRVPDGKPHRPSKFVETGFDIMWDGEKWVKIPNGEQAGTEFELVWKARQKEKTR